MFFTMASPSPRPSSFESLCERARKYLSNTLPTSSRGMPTPWSATETTTFTASSRALTVMAVPREEYLMALLSRLMKTCLSRSGSPSMRGSSAGTSTATRMFFSRSDGLTTDTASSTMARRSIPVREIARWPNSILVTSRMSLTMRISRLVSLLTISRNSPRCAKVGSPAFIVSVSTYALIEVSGVRSSCDTWFTKSDLSVLAFCDASRLRSRSRILRSSES